MKFVFFGFGLGTDIGIKSVESMGGKQPFLVFLSVKGVLNPSEKYAQKHDRREVKKIFMNAGLKFWIKKKNSLGQI